MSNVVIFANAQTGIDVCDYFSGRSDDNIVALYLSDSYPEIDSKIIKASKVDNSRIFKKENLSDGEHIKWIKAQSVDFIITVYWPYLLKPDVFKISKNTINFHPALLPINRGWFPHVHSIIDGTPLGVTLHAIDETADTGPIWAQKEIKLDVYDTAIDVYKKLQKEIVKLFIDEWERIRDGNVIPVPQDEQIAIYHSKSEINDLDEINLNGNYMAKDLINIMRARSFGKRGFVYYIDEGKKVFVNIRLSDTTEFGE